MSNTQDQAAIAQALVNGDPLSYKFYPDGSLVVIAPSGQKLRFTPEQVGAAEKALKTPVKGKSSASRGRKKVQPSSTTTSEEK